ncbi:hypothetical protein DTO027B5_709 [Paecilomyces variotii]|nr:hypothetical protein DTO169C6_507 [Paecilomyces variotii]KAJ9290089.1 hypothetical protein DTO021C3_2447 [Paecilomyces variotii]KAJ9329519.1 hypothetical protein DTO027B3_6 [Paecilomyces variotii]KAJ9337360.1 hypothetical protein DTO027B5_709 [Paecilomyces variotii]
MESTKRIRSLLKEVENKDEQIETLNQKIQEQHHLVRSFDQEIALYREERRGWAEQGEESLLKLSLREQVEELKRRLSRAIHMADVAETQAIAANTTVELEKARRDAANAESIEMARAEEQRQRALAIEAAKSAAKEATGEEDSSESEISDADDDEPPTYQPPTFAPSTSYQPPKYQPWRQQYQAQSTQQTTDPLYKSLSATVLPAAGTPTTASAISPSAAKVFGGSLPSSSRSPIYTPSPSCSQQQVPHGQAVEVSSLPRPALPGKPDLERQICVPPKEYRDKCIGTESAPGKVYQDKSVGTEPVQGKEYADKCVGTDLDVLTTPIPQAGDGEAMGISAQGPILLPDSMDLYDDSTMADALESLPTPSVQPLSERPAPLYEGLQAISWLCQRGGHGRVTKRQLVPQRSKNPRDLVRITMDATKRRGLVRAVFEDAIVLSALPVTRFEPGYVACDSQVPQQQPYTEPEVVSNEGPDSESGISTAQNCLPTIHQAEPETPWANAAGSNPGLGVFAPADSPSGSSVPEITAATYQEVACQTEGPSMNSTGVQTAGSLMTSSQTQTLGASTTSSGTQTPARSVATAATQTQERPVISAGTMTQYSVESRACQSEERPEPPEIRVKRHIIVSELVQSASNRIRLQTGLGARNGRLRFLTPAPLLKGNKERPAALQQGQLPGRQPIPAVKKVDRSSRQNRQAQTDTDKLSGEKRQQVSELDGCRDRRWNRQWWIFLALLLLFLVLWIANLEVEAQDCRLWFEANDVARRAVIARRRNVTPQPLWTFAPEHTFF